MRQGNAWEGVFNPGPLPGPVLSGDIPGRKAAPRISGKSGRDEALDYFQVMRNKIREGMEMVVGSTYTIGKWPDKRRYMVTHPNGTIERIGQAPWYRVFALAILQAAGKRCTIQEAKDFLFPKAPR